MSTVRKVGSALKRAALYVPRKIRTGIHSYLHTRAWRKAIKNGSLKIEDGKWISIEGMPKFRIIGDQTMFSDGIEYLEEEASGPFASTVQIKKIGKRFPLKNAEHVDDHASGIIKGKLSNCIAAAHFKSTRPKSESQFWPFQPKK